MSWCKLLFFITAIVILIKIFKDQYAEKYRSKNDKN